MAAPKVQSVEQIIRSLNPAYQGSINVIQKRQAQLPGMFNAQKTALGAEKVQGFNQINSQMNARGLGFSGITGEEQANYLSTKYLPGMQMLAQQENEQRLSLDEALAKINQERRLGAMDIRRDQTKTLESYLSEQRQRAWERQKFNAQMALERAQMAQQASIAAANRAAKDSGPSATGMVSSISEDMNKRRGKDGFVSPQTFRKNMQSWMAKGGSPSAFTDAFGGYVNPMHQKLYGGYY